MAASVLVLLGASPAVAATNIKLDFAPATSATAVGYAAETGQPYSEAAGRGWVRDDSLSAATHVPLDLSAYTRQRSSIYEQRMNTLAHSQTLAPAALVKGAFEVAVPNGAYDVKLGMGDTQYYDSVHAANVEGRPLVTGFVPSSSAPVTASTGRFFVSDGRLTIDFRSGTNAKVTYLEITDAPVDTEAPAVPRGLTAAAGVGSVTLSWLANSESDLAGYDLYRSTTTPVAIGGAPLNAATPTSRTYTDTAVVAGTTYHYALVARDFTGNRSAASAAVPATPTAPPTSGFHLNASFQPAGEPTPVNYTADIGGAFDATRGFGWVRQNTLTQPTHIPLDATGRTRKRGVLADARLDTHIMMAPAKEYAGAWEVLVPEGDYSVTVAAGDPSFFDSVHRVNVEGTTALNFTPTSANRMASATINVRVTDGRLTLDSTGGTNTKLQYVTIDSTTAGGDTEAPASPSTVEGNADASGVHLAWTANTESDLAGYKVYRSTTVPVPSGPDATPVSGTAPITVTAFNDATIQPTQQYYYVVRAVDTSGNASGATSPVAVTQPAPQIDLNVNFQPDSAPVPAGYAKDTGAAFTANRGFGWVRVDSLSSPNHLPLDLSPNARDRNVLADQRIDTLIHMQAQKTDIKIPGAWEVALPNGAYDVTVSVGDPSPPYDSLHAINVEGQPAISEFVPTANLRHSSGSLTVNVADGRLTLDPIGGVNTKINYVQIKTADAGTRPSVGMVQPADGATNVTRSRAITAEVNLPNLGAGVDAATLNEDSVRLERVSDGAPVNMNRNTSAGGDVIVAQPRSALEPNTSYRFEVNSLLHDVSGAKFIPKTVTFTTGSSTSQVSTLARFAKAPQAEGQGEMMASLAIGPDNRLYATTLDGKILRFPIGADGTLGAPTIITTVVDHENGPRHIIGIAFDPASTAEAPVAWISHSHGAWANAPDWEGKISRLSGADLGTYQDVVIHLPRSVRDHETNSLAFGPDGKLYLAQGSNSAGGAADVQWGDRPERTLSAAILRLDPSAIGSLPLDAKTAEGGTYDPLVPGAPLTVYASGVRNSFDLVWHRNGQLYSAVNGSAAGSNTPATPSTLPASCNNRLDFGMSGPFTGPPVQALTKVGVQPDLLLRVQQGGYYGHANPTRCEYAFFGGNPTNDVDPQEIIEYPSGTLPDRNFRRASWDLGLHFSPNGTIEYKGNAWNGALNGALLVARYSAGDDVVALTVDGQTKEINDQIDGIPGLAGFIDPLDLVEDTRNGNVYVTELGAGRITLLRPDETGGKPKVEVTPTREIANSVVGSVGSPVQTVTIRNSGNAPLRLSNLQVVGPNASRFQLSHLPLMPQSIAPDNELTVDVRFVASAVGLQTATLQVTTDDPVNPVSSVALRGLGTAGEGGNLEPSLQRVLDTFEIPVNVGDDDPNTTVMPQGATLGEEVPFQSLRKAGSGPVRIEPLAVFAPQGPGSAVGQFGWSETGDGTDRSTLFQIPNSQAQRLEPRVLGSTSFDPGDRAFGLWSSYAAFDYSVSYSEDALNTIAGGPSHQARAYPLKSSGGAVVPNAYVVVFEDLGTTPQDFQDVVVIVRNVQPDGVGDGRVQLTNLDGAAFDDRLVFNRIGSLTAPPPDGVHDRATVRIRNTGTTPFHITELPITGPFQVVNAPTLPATVAPNATLDLQVRFIATSGRVSQGNLTIRTDSAVSPTTRVQLAGYWQAVPENDLEPSMQELVNEMFGYATKIVNFGQAFNNHGKVEAIGDEVLSPYWRRVDPSKGVRVTQLAAWHGAGSKASFKWFQRGGDVLRPGVVHAAIDAQSALPHLDGSTTALASTLIYPAAQFGFNIDNEWSDPALNNQQVDRDQGCLGACGHHVRVWPAKNRTGQIIAGTYIVGMDYAGINYDYQDNLYLVSNITPDTETQRVLYRVNAGSTSAFTDTRGRVWAPDTGLFTPAAAPSVGTVTDPISNTADDRLYATTRTAVPTAVQNDRVLDYRFPTGTATEVDIRLHFAERQFTATGQRRFDVLAEGVRKQQNLDVFQNAQATNRAWSVAYNGIPVTDGALDLRFKATIDYPTISGIEVLCAANCGSD